MTRMTQNLSVTLTQPGTSFLCHIDVGVRVGTVLLASYESCTLDAAKDTSMVVKLQSSWCFAATTIIYTQAAALDQTRKVNHDV